MLNVLTVDVEEYFHPSEVQLSVTDDQWDSLPSRVELQTLRVLELLALRKAEATFFVLGWVAERYPRLIREIANAGHEIGCHSYAHKLVYDLTPAGFRMDTLRAQAAIEDACGVSPQAYRAPSYSITTRSDWALEILVECGFKYDSSIYPVSHDRYGIPGFYRYPQKLETSAGPIFEVPVATVQLPGGRVAPVGGGGYLRLLPYRYTAAGIRRIHQDDHQPAVIYFHPWELDPEQPRMPLRMVSRLRTYTGVSGMASKLDRLISEFQFSTIARVYPQATAKPVDAAALV
ncbi:MAG TPA: XrtA system polysaccharide deacetylase [Terriglobales bacterium]|jgi:polysaccharide deacetylase family protein (PEP-CTERM system associated)